MKKSLLSRLKKDERGQALLLVLILMLLGGLIVTPLLSHMGTGLKVGKEVYEEKMYRLYAADSGVEDALWQIKNDKLTDLFGIGYNQYNYGYPYPYPPSHPVVVNNKNVAVTIENVWIPKITAPGNADEALKIARFGNTNGESQVTPRLIITGSPSQTNPATQYQIGINYYYGSEGTDALKVQSIGIWLPPGFHYVSGSSNLTGASENKTPYKSGEAVVWTFSSPYPMFKNLPGIPTTPPIPNPMVSIVTFSFTADTAGQTPSCVSWIETSGVISIPYAWDADKKVYGINSVAKDNPDTGKDVTVDAYTLKTEPRQMGSAMSGDYVAIGNSLMMPDLDNPTFRNQLLMSSSAAIQDSNAANPGYIPPNATVEGVYLYWSGFIDHYYWKATTSHGQTTWSWSDDPNNWSVTQDDWTGLVYDANSPNNLTKLINNSKVNTVSFGTTGAMQDVTATQYQVCLKDNDSPKCWYYTCYYDATAQVQQLIKDRKVGADGSGTYTLGHASQGSTSVINKVRSGDSQSSHTYSFTFYNTSNYTGYPLGTPAHKLPGESSYGGRYNASYAGWSLVIIYSSTDTKGHQLYLYDISNPNFKFKESYQSDMDFDGDGKVGGKISGFLVPQPVAGETIAAKLTCFIGEGDADSGHSGDFIAFNAPSQYTDTYSHSLTIPDTYKLWDGVTCTGNTSTSPNNVWNSMSRGASASGVDIDTFYIPWQTGGQVPYGNPNFNGLLHPGDTWTQINLPSPNDGVTLSYIIVSFRSATTTGGTITYLIR